MASVTEAASIDAHKVGYIVLSHHHPSQVLRLVDRLVRSDPAGHVVIAHDPTSGGLGLGAYAGHRRVHLLTSSLFRGWGGYGLVADLLEAIMWAVSELDVGWLAVLSGDDYPLRSLASLGRELDESGFDAFLSARPVQPARPPATDTAGLYMHARYFYRWYRLPSWFLGWAAGRPVERLVHGAQRRFSSHQPVIFLWSLPRGAGDMIGFRRRRPPFDSDFECYVGPQWLTISRAAAVVVLESVQRRADVVALYRRSIIADESLIPTMILNDPQLRVRDCDHHYTRMAGPGQSHAAVLGMNDLEQLRRSRKPFARKFDEHVDDEILDRLDQDILARAS